MDDFNLLREMRAMRLDPSTAHYMRDFFKTIDNYPMHLFVSTGEELEEVAYSLGAYGWKSVCTDIAESLSKGHSPEVFARKLGCFLVGHTEPEYCHYAIMAKYRELYDKAGIAKGAMFVYKLGEKLSPRIITFERVSSIELFEHELSRLSRHELLGQPRHS